VLLSGGTCGDGYPREVDDLVSTREVAALERFHLVGEDAAHARRVVVRAWLRRGEIEREVPACCIGRRSDRRKRRHDHDADHRDDERSTFDHLPVTSSNVPRTSHFCGRRCWKLRAENEEAVRTSPTPDAQKRKSDRRRGRVHLSLAEIPR